MEFERLEEKLRETIKEYEDLCNRCLARTKHAKELFKLRSKLFDCLGLEFCAHNAAIYGSERYKDDKFSGINHSVTPAEYEKLMNEKITRHKNELSN